MMQDLKYAVRVLRKRPMFTVVAVATLALGIGANTAIFSVVNAVLLQPLPFEDPDRLVRVYATRGPELWTASPPDYTDWRRDNETLVDLGAFYRQSFALSGIGGGATQVTGAVVSASLFPLLGVAPARGAALSAEHEIDGAELVVILGDTFWRSQFGGDPEMLGRPITLGGDQYTVIGIMPSDFSFPSNTDFWVPLRFTERDLTTQRGAHYLTVVGRLKNGVAVERAAADLSRLADAIAEAYPRSNVGWSATVVGMQDALVSDVRPALIILLGAVGLVLLIACVNVANLLLARAVGRNRELAIRAALGARRSRLIRALMTESVVLGLLGGGVGVLLAVWGTSLIAALQVGNIPRLDEVGVDRTVLLFAIAISVLAGVAFGVLPAMQASLVDDVNRRLKDSGRSQLHDRRSGRTRHTLVIAELALAVTLVVAAGLLLRSFAHLTRVQPGFDPEGVIAFNLTLPDARYAEAHESEMFFAELLERVRALPGVEHAGGVFGLPMSGFSYSMSAYELDGIRLEPEEQDRRSTQVRVATPGYFESLGIRILRGRTFAEQDRADAEPVLVVNESAARLLWPDEDPLGHRLTIGTSFGLGRGRAGGTVVGVIPDIHDLGLDEAPRPQIYFAHRQFPVDFMSIAVRTSGDPSLVMEPIRRLVAELDAEVPVYAVRPVTELVKNSIAEQRFYLRAVALFAMIALILAVIGTYGVMAYGVAQRTGEIGIRLALGARRAEVLGLVVGQGMRIAVLGIGIGLVGAYAATRLMASVLYGVQPTDVLTFVLAAVVLSIAAFLACYLPARRATHIDPMEALRYE